MRIVLADNNEFVGANIPPDPRVECDYLFSFWYAKKMEPMIRAFRSKPRLPATKKVYLDSGVFSARKKNVVLPVESLVAYYEAHCDVINYVFSMDEGDHKQQIANAKQMADAGCPVIPIYHGTMPLSMIDELAAISPYIAVSFFAVGGPTGPNVWPYLDKIFNYVDKAGLWPLKMHALGTEQFSLLARYPFYSADSTSWATNYFLRKAAEFDPVKQKVKTVGYGADLEKAKKLAGALSVEHVQSTKEARLSRALSAAQQRAKLQRMLTNTWQARGIKWDQ